MAFRARLAPPLTCELEALPELEPQWTALSAHVFWKGDRRMEAENYLSTGYGLRLAIEERATGWQRLASLARVWQPSRLKGIQVGSDTGTAFLAATQVFDTRPVPANGWRWHARKTLRTGLSRRAQLSSRVPARWVAPRSLTHHTPKRSSRTIFYALTRGRPKCGDGSMLTCSHRRRAR